MSKGKRLRAQHKMEMMTNHMRQMQQREAIRRAFAMTPIAIAVKNICQNWGK
jgi:hypothetical protein